VVALVATPDAEPLFQEPRQCGDGAFRRLSRRLEPELLYLVSPRRLPGRTGEFSPRRRNGSSTGARARVEERPPQPLLLGRHLLEMGIAPGPIIGRITRAVYELQLDGRIADLEAARREARRLLDAGPD